MNLLAAAGAAGSLGAPRRGEVVDARLRLGVGRTRPGSARRCRAPARSDDPGRAVAARGRGLRPRLRRGQPARDRDAAALRQRARHRHRHARSAGPAAAGRARPSSASTPCFQFVEEDDVVRCDRVRHPTGACPGIYNVAGDGRLPVERGGRASAASAPLPAAPRRHRPAAAARWRRLGVVQLPARAARPAALRPRRRQPPPARQAGFDYRYTSAGRGRELRPGRAAAAGGRRRADPPTATSGTSSSSSATPPPSSESHGERDMSLVQVDIGI